MEDRLRECPRCKTNDCVLMESGVVDGRVFPLCKHCDLEGPWFERAGEAVEWWNTRATDPLLEEMAEALELMMNIYYGRDKQSYPGQFAKMADEALQKYQEATCKQGAR